MLNIVKEKADYDVAKMIAHINDFIAIDRGETTIFYQNQQEMSLNIQLK